MTFRKKIVSLLFALFLIVSQTGCVGGIFFWPLWIPGIVTSSVGISMALSGYHYRCYHFAHTGDTLFWAGTILDEKNPLHQEVMNELPRGSEFLKKLLQVGDEQIEDYNDHLNRIQEVAQDLKADIRSQSVRLNKRAIFGEEDFIHDPQINALAEKYGFLSAKGFLETFHQEKLTREQVQAFAERTQLSLSQARIMLILGFGVQVE
ncbi:MAG: hypothetical protein ACO3A2_02375 [Bdellovibrionia bacterium]